WAAVVGQCRRAVARFVPSLGAGAVVAYPDRPGEHQDVGAEPPRVDLRPFVSGPAVLGHVRPDAGGDVVVRGADRFHGDTLLAHDAGADVDQALGIAALG